MADNETGELTAKEQEAAIKAAPKTGANTHRATERGYAEGQLIEEGDIIPAGVVIADADDDGGWMEKIKGNKDLAAAVEEALDPHPKDVDMTALSKPALEAMAAERGINAGGLSKADLITAIAAAREKDAG